VNTEQPCPICEHAMVTLSEAEGEAALMCSYCTYNCVVLADGGEQP
jgi:transcription elongation factor Elf1